MKKVLVSLTAAALCVSSIGLLTGCGLFGGSAKKVDDYDSFMAAADKKAKIELTADIDFGGKEVTPIALKSLNGNGHTIKNVKVLPGINMGSAHYISLLGEHTEEVKNVTFDNITIEDDGYAKYASFVAAACLEMDGVVVKNSNMKVKDGLYIGGLTCKQKYMSITNDFQTEGSCPTNSGIEDCTITTEFSSERLGGICTSGVGTNLYAKNLTINAGSAERVGGLLADGAVENCHIESCNIYAKSYNSDGLNPLYVGGLVGTSSSSAKNSYVIDSEIKADAPFYDESKISGIGGVSAVYVGGIAAYADYNFEGEYCYSSNNEIIAISTGNAYAGGIIGSDAGKGDSTIKQCCATDNYIWASGYAIEYRADVYSPKTRGLGGIVGNANNCALSSSFAYGNKVLERTFENIGSLVSDHLGESYFSAGGLIGYKSSGVTVSDCAVASKELHALNNSGEVFGNDRLTHPETAYDDLTEEEWLDGTTILTKLKLDAERWVSEAGKLPTLKK